MKQSGLVAFDLSDERAVGLCRGEEGLLLAIHRVTGIDHPGQTQLTDQRRHAGNFVGLAVDRKMGKDDLLGDRKCT